MSTAEAWTVGRLLTWTADYLKKYGSTSPRLDAEVLLAEARGCSRIDLYTAFGEEPSEQVRASFKEMVRRRAEGSPVAYLVGRKEFYSLNFEVNPDVLIPRPETEHLVVEAIDRAKQLTGQSPQQLQATTPAASANHSQADSDGAEPEPWRPKPIKSYAGLTIADVGTGSGIVAVALAKALPGARIWALDNSTAALALAERNVQHHDVTSQVTLLHSDLMAEAPQQSFDIVVSNPPYISQAEYDALPVSVRNYEPRAALVAGAEGTEIIARLLQQCAERVRPSGWLLMEISPMIAQRVIELIDQQLWEPPSLHKDLAGLARIVATRHR